jgi:hypothetical protein
VKARTPVALLAGELVAGAFAAVLVAGAFARVLVAATFVQVFVVVELARALGATPHFSACFAESAW